MADLSKRVSRRDISKGEGFLVEEHPMGTLALIGGSEWQERCSFDAELLATSASKEVIVLPTAAAYESPESSVAWATQYFKKLGAKVKGVMILSHADAMDERLYAPLVDASFIYMGGGSPLHLRSVLKSSPAWGAIVDSYRNGAVLAGSSAGAMVITDPMADPRGGALTVGLGLLRHVAVVPHFDTWPKEREARTVSLASEKILVVGIDEETALIRRSDSSWYTEGAGQVQIFSGHGTLSLDDLEGHVEIVLSH